MAEAFRHNFLFDSHSKFISVSMGQSAWFTQYVQCASPSSAFSSVCSVREAADSSVQCALCTSAFSSVCIAQISVKDAADSSVQRAHWTSEFSSVYWHLADRLRDFYKTATRSVTSNIWCLESLHFMISVTASLPGLEHVKMKHSWHFEAWLRTPSPTPTRPPLPSSMPLPRARVAAATQQTQQRKLCFSFCFSARVRDISSWQILCVDPRNPFSPFLSSRSGQGHLPLLLRQPSGLDRVVPAVREARAKAVVGPLPPRPSVSLS